MVSLNSGSLLPGKYEVTISLTQGDKVMERGTKFRIGGGEMANAAIGEKQAVGTPKEVNLETGSSSTANEFIATRRQPLAITALPSGSAVRPS